MNTFLINGFEQWRELARDLIISNQRPEDVRLELNNRQRVMFADNGSVIEESVAKPFHVPKQFMKLAEAAAYHRTPDRWNLLYRILWRILNETSHLLEITTDDDVLRLHKLEKEVRRDAHKMKAFVRFRKIIRDGEEQFIAWHRPDHRIVRKVAPFFSRCFKGMNWTILTPHESVTWDQQSLEYGPGVPRSKAPDHDELEELWRTYYASIFNPARVKVKMMKSEMPVRHWTTLPEADIIDNLLEKAPRRVEEMIAKHEGFSETASNYLLNETPQTLSQLLELAAGCTACDLHRDATQTVFGIGPSNAKLVLVGEQPGDLEDVAGEPFIGPAGKVLDAALAVAGIDRDQIYLTNIVKHFKHKPTQTPKGKKRLHQKPNAREVRCCRPWFEAEWELLTEAESLVCLGRPPPTPSLAQAFESPNNEDSSSRPSIAGIQLQPGIHRPFSAQMMPMLAR